VELAPESLRRRVTLLRWAVLERSPVVIDLPASGTRRIPNGCGCKRIAGSRGRKESTLSELVHWERRGTVALVTLDRPEALNALSPAVLEAFDLALSEIEAAEDVRAVVVTGAGRAFVAGADIAAMTTMTPLEAEVFSVSAHRVFARLEGLALPTIAAVNGFALGGGCELALACDWIYASSQARLGQPETKLGLIPGFGGTSRLVRRVGLAWAKELVLVAEPIGADEAARIGLVNRIFEPEELLEAAIAAGASVAMRGPVAVRLAKRVMQQGQDADVRTAHALEQQAFGLAFASEDRVEGTQAFLEKRAPEFSGR
jgi:enoyl-CoA hydratase